MQVYNNFSPHLLLIMTKRRRLKKAKNMKVEIATSIGVQKPTHYSQNRDKTSLRLVAYDVFCLVAFK